MSDAAAVQVLEQEKRRWAALLGSDVVTLKELFEERMIYTHSNAMLDSKDSYIGALESGAVAYTGVRVTDEQVRVFGGTAVVTGAVVIDARAGGRDLRTHARYSAVWAEQDGRWRFVCWHSTPIPG
ncbi:nuclear transport factor 2 family protein [Microbispora sp. CA-102843]|uniref:nuclear transport factor 2 family protein n=1 Tax=Microbispora sp. CA-102843 TaxID=3239952 RepID=UPI003D89CAEE